MENNAVSQDEIVKRINDFPQFMRSQMEEQSSSGNNEEVVEEVAPVDIYQSRKNTAYKRRGDKERHGADRVAVFAARTLADRLAPAFRRYRDDCDYLQKKNEREKAMALRESWIYDQFLPVVDAVIMQSSPRDLLNSTEALRILDGVSGAVGSGFTEGYVRKAYDGMLDETEGGSDDTVRISVGKIRCLSGEGQIRAAVGLAKQLKQKIDNGDNSADDDDYMLIARVANFR